MSLVFVDTKLLVTTGTSAKSEVIDIIGERHCQDWPDHPGEEVSYIPGGYLYNAALTMVGTCGTRCIYYNTTFSGQFETTNVPWDLPRSNTNAIVIGHGKTLFIPGGETTTNQQWKSTLMYFDLKGSANASDYDPNLIGLKEHCFVQVNNTYAVLSGGKSGNVYLKTTYLYHIPSSSWNWSWNWTLEQDMLVPRRKHACGVANDIQNGGHSL